MGTEAATVLSMRLSSFVIAWSRAQRSRPILAALLALGLGLGPARAAEDAPGQGHAMVAAANPLAAAAGMAVLRAGGGAADAAVAIQAVLGLVEPQSSGLGGGAFMTFYDARTHAVTAYDGRETAPAGAGPDMFLKADGTPLPFFDAVMSGRSTGAPGAVAMLALAHRQHGRLAWSALFGEAERLGDEGFVVSPRLGNFVNSAFPPQSGAPDIVAYFSQGGAGKVKTGDRLRNPAYAALLRRLAAQGPRALYTGEVARDMAARVHADPLPGTLSEPDLAGYRAKAAAAICRPHRAFIVCVPPPPSSGVALLQALDTLDHTDIAARGPTDPKAWLQFIQASRLMYADRDRYIGDPRFVAIPMTGLLDPAYVASRAALIGDRAGPPPGPGLPPGAARRAADATAEPGGTSHFVVVDAWGDVVSMTTSVESVFGSGRMSHGFVLNNQLTDFSFSPKDPDGTPAANAAAAGKQPRSSMSPVIVLDQQGRFYAALGSPGGNAILAYNLKTLVALLDWGLPVDKAIALPNIIARGAAVSAETSKMSPALVQALAAGGITLRPGQGEDSGLHAITAKGGRLQGAADPRREGVVLEN
jgi:gamma-glutamyltranspeptidase/glutathione hydrolase